MPDSMHKILTHLNARNVVYEQGGGLSSGCDPDLKAIHAIIDGVDAVELISRENLRRISYRSMNNVSCLFPAWSKNWSGPNPPEQSGFLFLIDVSEMIESIVLALGWTLLFLLVVFISMPMIVGSVQFWVDFYRKMKMSARNDEGAGMPEQRKTERRQSKLWKWLKRRLGLDALERRVRERRKDRDA